MSLPDLSRLKVSPVPRAPPAVNPVSEPPEADNYQDDFEEPEVPEVVKSPEVAAKEEDARLIVSLYKMKFGEELKGLAAEFARIAEMDLAELEVLRDRCDKILGGNSGLEVKKRGFNAALYVLEKIGCMSGVKCEGLTATLLADKDYQRDLMRLALKYLSASDCNPLYTVPIKVLTTAMQLHASAEANEKKVEIQNKIAANIGAIDKVTAEFKAVPPGPPK